MIAAQPLSPERGLPPVWRMGLGFLPLGVVGALLFIAVPQLLAAKQVPEQQIASITAIGFSPSVLSFLLTPLLDWRFRRRSYALGFTLAGAVCSFAALACIDHPAALTALLFLAELAVSLGTAAVGGWFGNLVATAAKGRLGAWFSVSITASFGVVAVFAIDLLRGLPYLAAAALLAACVLLPLPLYVRMPCPAADQRLATESFAGFARDVAALLARPAVLWTLLIFLLPAASFALPNVLGGFGNDFATPEALVALLGGVASSGAGVVGSLGVARAERLLAPRPLYLVLGATGALFTLGLSVLPREPLTFGIAMLGENLFQGAAFAVQYLIVLRTIGNANPLAATQFGLLIAAANTPLVYMQLVDGMAYAHFGGPQGSFRADALLSGACCALLGGLLWRYRAAVARADREA
jgi:PAT family beta-lactamase induction signal transducer AmpG